MLEFEAQDAWVLNCTVFEAYLFGLEIYLVLQIKLPLDI